MTIKAELLALKRGGVIVPKIALAWARKHPKSALHSAINWDADYNINGYLLLQVRNLISLNIRTEDSVPEAISLSIDRMERDGGGYREIADVLAVPRLRKIMLDDALHEIELLQRRFDELQELEVVWEAAATVARKTEAKQAKRSVPERLQPSGAR